MGSGTTTLTAVNTYSGGTVITNGALQLGNGGSTGSLATNSAITNNATFIINRNNAVAQGTDFSSAAITGTGSFVQAGSGTTTLNAANTYSGGTTLNTGTLAITNTGTLGTGTLTVNGGTVDLGTKTITNTLAPVTVGVIQNGTISNNGGNYSISGGTINAILAGNNALTASGGTLGAANTYTGTTTITSSGTLVLGSTGSLASTNINLGTSGSPGTLDLTAKSSYTMAANQTLSGDGLVNIGTGKTLTINGGLNPGNSPGIINVTGDVVLGSTSVSTFEIFGTNAGTGYDQLNVTGNLTYGGTLNLITTNGITPLTGTNYFNLFTATGTSTPNLTNVALAGSWTGSFTNTGGVWNFYDAGTSLNWSFSELNGQLAIAAVPEPADLVYFGGLISAAVLIYRRRKNRD